MNPLDKIDLVIEKKVLPEGLVFIPTRGATDLEISQAEKQIRRSIPQCIQSILLKWNGLHLDIINFFGCGNVENCIRLITENQLENYDLEYDEKLLAFADSPAGYLFLINLSENIYSFDFKTLQYDFLSVNFQDFICKLIFGTSAREFAGKGWEEDLIKAGII